MAAETSADVCYRHPNRESWTLCGRCGRTICPECQILTPAGVRCPDCVKETGGSVTWTPATAKTPRPARQRAARSPRRESSDSASSWGGGYARMFRPGPEAPIVTWSTVAITAALWVVGIFTTVPLVLLAMGAGDVWQVWRFFTGALIYPPAWQFLFSILLTGLFFLLIAPTVEDRLGRGRFLALVLAGAAAGNAAMALAGLPGFGLTGVLYAAFGGYLVLIWSYPAARIQAIVIIAINIVISLAFGGSLLPELLGGLIAGVGATYAFTRDAAQTPRGARNALLIVAAAVAGAIALAILRTYAF